MSSTKCLLAASFGSLLFLLAASSGSAGTLVDPGGLVEDLVADPARNVFYATLDTQEIVTMNASTGGITDREMVSDDLGALAVASDGSKLYVALDTAGTVEEYDLPGVNFNRSYAPSGSQGNYPGLAAKPGRLYVSRQSGLAIMDTATGAELYYGNPISPGSGIWSNRAVLRLSPDGNTLYAMNNGLSPASIDVVDVTEDTPRYLGEDCCHGCIGGNGRTIELSPDGSLAYVAVGGQYHLQVLNAVPMLHDKYAGLTGPYPNAIAVAADGDHVYVGYSDAEFAVVRTSDWLPFHVGALQGDVVPRGLALSYGQNTLAAVIEFTNFDPDRIELIDVGNPPANRGGVRVNPVDSEHQVPVLSARVSPPYDGNSSFVDVSAGLLGRAPIEPDDYDAEVRATGYTTETRSVTVTAGQWTDLGQVTMTRTAGTDMPRIAEVCASPAAVIGQTVDVDVTGVGFFPGEGLEVTTTDANITIDSFVFQNWSSITATVSVDPGAPPGLSYYDLRVDNPDGDAETGHIVAVTEVPMFDDGFESGDLSGWWSHVP